jgi:hypothetical protein
MASKVCVFDNAINSRSPFIVHMRGVIFLAMTLPRGALNRADRVRAIATGREADTWASNFRPTPGAMRRRRKSEGNRRQGDD